MVGFDEIDKKFRKPEPIKLECTVCHGTTNVRMRLFESEQVGGAPTPPLDPSPTGGVNVVPSAFGAWYPSGYNATVDFPWKEVPMCDNCAETKITSLNLLTEAAPAASYTCDHCSVLVSPGKIKFYGYGESHRLCFTCAAFFKMRQLGPYYRPDGYQPRVINPLIFSPEDITTIGEGDYERGRSIVQSMFDSLLSCARTSQRE